MKTLTKLCLLAAACTMLAAPTVPAAPTDEPDADAPAVPSKITAVTVYADRARVTRTALNVPLGGKVAFRKLPGWIDEGSVRVSLTPASAGELLDVQILKTYLTRPDDEELHKAETAVQALNDQLAVLADERAALDAQAQQVSSIRAFSLEKFPKDTAVREVKVDEYAGVVKFIGNALAELARNIRDLEKKRRDLQPTLAARQRELDDLRQRAQLEQRTVVVTTSANAAAQATLTLTYLVPGASWEPVHELRTANDTDKVTLASFGVVTQTTGEDWTGVALTLSTQRPAQTIHIPELEKLLVGGSRPLTRLTEQDSFGRASSSFTGQIMLWNKTQNNLPQQAEFAKNYEAQNGNVLKVTTRFEALQEQRGTTAHFDGLGAQTVRSDGRTVRVPLGSAQLVAQPKIVAAPELSLSAARTAELVNSSRQPLLPGQVLLYVAGAFLGTTEVDFVAPGETFPMFLGVADSIKLARTLDKKNSSLTWSGKRARMQVSYVVTAENLGDQPVALQLGDRVPVSETEEVRVLNTKLTPVARLDNQGLVKWDVKLAAKETKEFRLEYMLEYPVGLPVTGGAAGSGGVVKEQAQQALPAFSGKGEGLRKQIEDLEKALH